MAQKLMIRMFVVRGTVMAGIGLRSPQSFQGPTFGGASD